MFVVVTLSTMLVIAPLVIMICYVIVNGLGAIDADFFTGELGSPARAMAGKETGLGHTMIGTFVVDTLALIISAPIGVAAGILWVRGQQQRLSIARALAIEPEVLLMDEPTSSLDPISSMKIEELIKGLSDEYAIVIVTHNLQQAARISDRTAFFYMGRLIEYDRTSDMLTRPSDKRTENYITGRFG